MAPNKQQEALLMQHRTLIRHLTEIGVVQHGSFTLKSGATSDIYVDLRRVISYPEVFTELAHAIAGYVVNETEYVLAGVPMGAIPHACRVADMLHKPMVLIRDERKDHGLGKLIEGELHDNDIILIEDVVTSGDSLMKTIKNIRSEGICIKKIIVILDREGNSQKIRDLGYNVNVLFTLDQLRSEM